MTAHHKVNSLGVVFTGFYSRVRTRDGRGARLFESWIHYVY
jgi:hypothetical protein